MSKHTIKYEIQHKGPSLSLCLNESEYLKLLRSIGIPYKYDWITDGSDGTTHTFVRNGNVLCTVCISDTLDSVGAVSMIVHESMHVWQEYKDMIGEDKPGKEQEAYGVQNIATALYKEYLRKKRALDKEES